MIDPFEIRKCSRLNCDNHQEWHTMFDRQEGYARICRSCFIAKNRMIKRHTDSDDAQMIEWFEQELKGIAA